MEMRLTICCRDVIPRRTSLCDFYVKGCSVSSSKESNMEGYRWTACIQLAYPFDMHPFPSSLEEKMRMRGKEKIDL